MLSNEESIAINNSNESLHLRNLLLRLLLTSTAASISETVTFPLDIIKTRVQLKNAVNHAHGKLPISISVATQMMREENFKGFYQGLSPAIFRHIIYTSTRIIVYEQLRGYLKKQNEEKGKENSDSIFQKAIIGGTSGVVGQALANPADLIKVRMQADGRGNRRYSSLMDAFNKIRLDEGIAGFSRGLVPNVQRAFLVNMGELACYDFTKCRLVRHLGFDAENSSTHAVSSIFSGLCATVLSCPADVVKTRMMNQTKKSLEKSYAIETEYKSSLDCLRKTVRVEGVRALWKGFLPTWARLGPWQLIFWTSYEKMRVIVGLPSF